MLNDTEEIESVYTCGHRITVIYSERFEDFIVNMRYNEKRWCHLCHTWQKFKETHIRRFDHTRSFLNLYKLPNRDEHFELGRLIRKNITKVITEWFEDNDNDEFEEDSMGIWGTPVNAEIYENSMLHKPFSSQDELLESIGWGAML